MKIFANIPGVYKLIHCLKYLKVNQAAIDTAKASGDRETEREYIRRSSAFWGPKVLEMFGSDLHVHGIENLPDHGPVVLVGNHQGYADIFTYCAAFQKFQFGFIAKEELAKLPLYGKWMERIRSVFIERKNPRASLLAIKKGIEYLNEGYSLVIFPEGTRSKGPDPGKFQKGALKLATKPKVPIVPISLNGTYRMFEEPGYLKGARIDVIVHEPIETKDLSRAEEKELGDRVEKIIVDGIRKLQAEEKERNEAL